MSVVVPHENLAEDFDDELEDRDQYFVQKLVEEFEDEPSILHNEYPETESDSEEEAEEGEPLVGRQRTPHIRRGDGPDGHLYKDQTFFNGVAFKEAVLDYALKSKRNLKQYRLFLDKIREEPSYYMPMKIEEQIQKWGIIVSRPQCQAARNNALKWIDWEYDQQFSRLRDYAAELLESNKDSTVEVDCLTNAEGQDVFNRFYVCFDVIRRTWKNTCRPLLGLDGTFFSGKIKGTVLVAMGRDADNRIYPVAWGVVSVENFDNWQWFLRKLKIDLQLNDGDQYIIVSDRQKGLIKAVQVELPKTEHRMCVRHIYGNLKKKHPSKKHMKPYIWNLAWSYNEPEFLENLDRLFNYDSGVYNDVMKQNPRSWCRAFYKKGNYCEDVENNSTESFNKTIKQARGKAFVPMLETIRRLAMARIAKRSAKSHGHNGICTPYVAKFLEKEHEEASKCIVTAATNGYYEAKLDGCPYRVNLDRRTCSCHKFEICGIPCKHAYGVIMVKVKVPEDYVCHWFRTATWKRNYEEGPIPVRGIKFWPTTGAPKVHPPPVPDKSEDKSKDPSVDQLVDQSKSKKTTKADHKRKRGVNESPTKKAPKLKKRIMHCGVCGDANHNSRKHKNDSNKGQGEASQANLTQAESSQGTLTQAPSSQAT
ncbi:unnamed protein product [Microthlaspi erraticum]|uniref:SWIM-type domain-containing protein n=1 Tax=Microthlaspi erraticum TaxID=1685480 RepID=A0A6D2JLC9_9BRAS|nr:unnamed protein product [Microthlaspi erraticum]